MSVTFTNEEFEIAFNEIYKRLTHNKTKLDKPKVVFLCGQPGAGKSRCGQLYSKQFNKDVVKSDVDDYREYHPHFKEIVAKNPYNWSVDTHEFASKMGYAIVEKLASEKYNVIVDGTLRSLQKTKELISMFKNNGYDNVEIAVTATKPDISKTQIILRYVNALEKKTPARLVPFEVHNDAIVSIPKNLNVIESDNDVDSIKIYDRDCLLLYDSLQNKSQDFLSGDMLEQIYSTQLNKYEQAWLKQTIDEIYPKLDPEDNETLELLKELKKINGEFKMDNNVVEKDNKMWSGNVNPGETYYYISYTEQFPSEKDYSVDYYRIDTNGRVIARYVRYGKISEEELQEAILEEQENEIYIEINSDGMNYFENMLLDQANAVHAEDNINEESDKWQVIDSINGEYVETSYEWFDKIPTMSLEKAKDENLWRIINTDKKYQDPVIFEDEVKAINEFAKVKKFIENENNSIRLNFKRMTKEQLTEWIINFGQNEYAGNSLWKEKAEELLNEKTQENQAQRVEQVKQNENNLNNQLHGGYEMEEQKAKNYIFINRITNSRKEENNGKIAMSVKIGDDVKFSRKSEEKDEIKASKELLEAYDKYLKDNNFQDIQEFVVLSKLEALQDYKTKADIVNQFKFCKEMPLNNQETARKQNNYCCVNVLDGEFSKQNAGKVSLTMRMGKKSIFNAKSDKTDKIEATKELLDQFNEYSKKGGFDNSDKKFYIMSNFKEDLLANKEAFSMEKYPFLDFGTQTQAEEKTNINETQKQQAEQVAEKTETFVMADENSELTMPF